MPRARPRHVPATADQIADRLHSAAIHLLRRLRREDAAAGLSGPRTSALSVLVFAGPQSIGELAAAEQVRPPTMTRLIKALERQGLVARRVSSDDARVTIIEATSRGIALLHAARARRVTRLRDAVASLPADSRRALGEGTAVLEEVLNIL